MLFPEKSNKWKEIKNKNLSYDLLYDINKKIGFRGKFIRYFNENNQEWPIRWYKKIYNLQLNNCEFNIFHEKRNIYAKIIR